MDEQRSMHERIVRLVGNQELSLAGSSSLWILRSGAVALFAVGSEADAARSRRRFLFRCETGAALYALPGRAAGDRLEVMAVALEPTELRLVTLPSSIPDGDVLSERWVQSWTDYLGPIEEEVAQENLAGFHEYVLDRLAEIEKAARQEEFQRFREREQRSNEQTQEAVSELTSVMQSVQPATPRGSGLFVAAHAVGRASGVVLRRPPRTREGVDAVEQIAAASHVRLRKVLLHDEWWVQDCGPLLAFGGEERRPFGPKRKAAKRKRR